MSFVSYSQNFEDLMLWRALRHIENGTYVDVGAQDPVADSVSKAFYEHGWRGTHIEPVPFYVERLRQDRPDEVVLQVALGETEGTLVLNVVAETGLSTAIDHYAHGYQERGFSTQQVHVPMLTLKTALQMLEGRDVHWLKIDVEGFEEQVLKGWDSTVLRPWIMIVEATIPGSSETDFAAWDPIVIAAGYRFAHFDGLNRFYVAEEHPELIGAFATPPNVFDDVQLSGYSSWGLYRPAQQRQEALTVEAEAAAANLRSELLAVQAATQAQTEALMQERDRMATRFAAAEQDAAALQEQLTLTREELAGQFKHTNTMRDQMRDHYESTHISRDLFQHLIAEFAGIRQFFEASNMSHAQFEQVVTDHRRAHLEHELTQRALVDVREQLAQANRANVAANDQVAELRGRTHEWWSVADRLSNDLKAMHASTSWRCTAPLRQVRPALKLLAALPRRVAGWSSRKFRIAFRPVLVWGMRRVLAAPGLRVAALALLQRQPGLKRYLQQIAGRAGLVQLSGTATQPLSGPETSGGAASALRSDLAPRVARLYGQLKKQSNKEDD